jgi:PAB-dependent poly(A)-specific ribonuclease subunit 2
MEAFGSVGSTPIVAEKRRAVLKSLLKQTTVGERDFMLTLPTSKLGVDLLANHNVITTRFSDRKVNDSIPNPNKTLYNSKVSSLCYEDGFNGKRTPARGSVEDVIDIPSRYQLHTRPGFSTSLTFDPSDFNETGLFPGWDYAPSMPNSWVCPVLLLLYFVPEVRAAALLSQFKRTDVRNKTYEIALTPELGFVFDQMESLSRYGLLYPTNRVEYRPKIGVWVPSNFLTFVSTMPESEQLQVLDGSPAAIDRPRRPESFYRFLAYQFDKELSSSDFLSDVTENLMNSLNGIDFLIINQFLESSSTPPTQSMSRVLTLELKYDIFPPASDKPPIRFGELLQHSMCSSRRLRAWNSTSGGYETVVQRKVAMSLPKMLTLACGCAGRKAEDGLWAWRTDHGIEPWLPELIDITLLPDGNVEVVEYHLDTQGRETSSQFRGRASLPSGVSKVISERSSGQKRRYRLDAVVSFVPGNGADELGEEDSYGHHVLHARIPIEYKRGLLKSQAAEARKLAAKRSTPSIVSGGHDGRRNAPDFVLSASVSAEEYSKRAVAVESQVTRLNGQKNSSEWVLYNGFKVTKTFGEDARSFHIPFKEPVLVVFREVDEHGEQDISDVGNNGFDENSSSIVVPTEAMTPPSLSSVASGVNELAIANLHEGRTLAFDAEFVAVQEEESIVSEAGQKLVVRETRHAVARISLFDCTSEEVLLDDHVLPREPVVDFLTRFSGIVAEDLDPSRAPHRIISTRNAYLQLRYLRKQGCVFVGHGLKQDFATVNIIVPPHQIIDTVEIFHKPGMRYVSLRFLVNYVLGRDMQQDTHDSIEDAHAAYELYQKALEWKNEGVFDERLQEIYSYGEKTSWMIRVGATT